MVTFKLEFGETICYQSLAKLSHKINYQGQIKFAYDKVYLIKTHGQRRFAKYLKIKEMF